MKLLARTLVLGAMLFGISSLTPGQVSFGIRIGPPPGPHAVRVHPVRPGPDYIWVDGYWYPVGNHYRWHEGYWTRPPYDGARWIGPHYDGGRYFEGYWEGEHGRVEHDHHWDHDRDRDYHRNHDDRDDHNRDHDHDQDHH